MTQQWSNWSGAVQCQPAAIAHPASLDQMRAQISAARAAGQGLRVAGSGHSFSPLCATDGRLLTLRHYSGVTAVDADSGKVRVRAGTPLRQLGQHLAEYGLAQENLGDIDVQAIAGALTTGTHGTGVGFGTLATQISGLRLLLADGSEMWCSPEQAPDVFAAARVSLGALGIITELELQCVPAYKLHYRSRKASLTQVLENLEAYKQEHRNFECYWFPYTDTVQLKLMDAAETPPSGNQRLRRTKDMLLENGALWGLSEIARLFPAQAARMARLCAWGVPAHDIVRPAHEIYATQRLVRFNESEYNIPAEAFRDCLRALQRMIERERIAVHFPLELRFVAADDIPLSPAYGRDSAYIAIHMYKGMAFDQYLREAEAIFDDFEGRPHWGKMHRKTAADFQKLYPRWADFLAVRRRLDPQGLFLNEHLRTVFGVPA